MRIVGFMTLYYNLLCSNLTRWVLPVVDKNGKPEVSVALTDFTGFIGFRPPSHIASFIEKNSELAALFNDSQIEALKKAASEADEKPSKVVTEAIKSIFDVLIKLSEEKAKTLIQALDKKIETQGAKAVFGDNANADALVSVWKRNMKTYGEGDVGILVTSFLMNLMQLPPGEGCWILADDIHAYVDGAFLLRTNVADERRDLF
jgi:mannose-6-phosphate isomerase